mgnify:CR=1 FL=1
MRYPEGHKEETRAKIVEVAARAFREEGLEGVSVSALMKRAGLTHGGFYGHFANRDELVAEAIAAASEQTAERVFKAAKTEEEMLDAYLSRAHLEHPEEGCVLAALGTDARRQPEVVRDAFAASSKGFIELIGEHTAKGDKSALSDDAIDTAIRMIGGMVLARLVDSEELSERILSIAKSRET